MKFSAPLFLALAAFPTAAAFVPFNNNGQKVKTALNEWTKKVEMDVIIPDQRGIVEYQGFSHQHLGSRRARPSVSPPKASAVPAPVEIEIPQAPEPVPVEQKVVEEIKVIRSGVSAEDVTDADAQAVQLAMDSMSRVCPNFHADLFGLVFWIQNGNSEESRVALEQLNTILDEETPEEQNTEALYRSGAYIDVVRTLQRNGNDEEMLKTGMEILQKLASSVRASQLAFKDIASLQASLASVGATDIAFRGMTDFSGNSPLCLNALSLISNLMDFFTFTEIAQTGLLDGAMAIIKDYEEDSSMVFVACDILYRGSRTKNADLSMLEEVQAVSLLAKAMEFFSGKDQKIHDKAAQALESLLTIGKN